MTTIVGYHGAALSNKNNILENGFESNERSDHWLGQGIYFYDDEDLAKWWAETKYLKKYNTSICVIKAEIQAELSQVLNLDKPKGIDYLFAKIKILTKSKTKVEISDNPITNLCFVLDYIKIEFGIAIVKLTFFKDKTSYGSVNIEEFEKNNFPLPLSVTYKEIQICVSDNTFIKRKECTQEILAPVKRRW